MGSIKDRNDIDLTEAQDIRRGGRNTQKNYTKKIFIVTVFVDWDLGTGVDEKREAGDPSLEWNKGTLFAEMHAYISLIKWLLSH